MEEGYIKDIEEISDEKQGIIRIKLKYAPTKQSVITGIKKLVNQDLEFMQER